MMRTAKRPKKANRKERRKAINYGRWKLAIDVGGHLLLFASIAAFTRWQRNEKHKHEQQQWFRQQERQREWFRQQEHWGESSNWQSNTSQNSPFENHSNYEDQSSQQAPPRHEQALNARNIAVRNFASSIGSTANNVRKMTKEQLNSAYRLAARRVHPDKNPQNRKGAQASFIKLKNSYNTVSAFVK